MSIDSITINLKNKQPIEINNVTDLQLLTLNNAEHILHPNEVWVE